MNILNKTQLRLFLKFARYLLPYWKKEAIILALSEAGVVLGLANPYLSKLVIDRAFGNKDLKVFIVLALIGGVIFVLNGLISGVESYLNRQIRIKVDFDLNKKVFKHLEKLDLGYFQNKSTGEHLFKSSYDIERVVDFITTTPPKLVTYFPRLLFILIILLRLNWQMAVFSLILAPFLYLPPYYFTKRMKRIWEDLIKNSQGIFEHLNDVFSHIQLVKAFAKEAAETRDYLRRKISNIRMSMRNTGLEVASGFAHSAANKVVIGLITFYGGYQVIKGQMSLGSLTAIMMYIGQLIGLEGSFAGLFQNTAFGLVSCSRLEEILDRKPGIIEKEGADSVIFKEPQILFRNVSFGYKQEMPVLSGINFNMDSAGHIALVGPSGCGKTTILNLILRLYEPWTGDIIIGGYDIRGLKISSLRGQIGITLQEPFLFNDTIENNIRYGRPAATEEDLLEVAGITGVDEFVKGLSLGYKTVIGENACKLSEGQKQKISIARALLKRPKILILDEAMSEMDSVSEGKIIAEIRKLPINIVILVSHRLSSVMACDRVYFLKCPDKMVIDKPQQILKNDREFYNLFAGQT